MKKKLNIDIIANELKGGSAFFPDYSNKGTDIRKEELAPTQKEKTSARQNASMPALQHAGRLAIQHTRKTDSQKSSNTEFQHASMPAFQNSGNPAYRRSIKPTEKVTYRFHPEGKYAIEDMRTILARQHGVKTSLEEIAEESILLVYEDLLENQKASKLASKLSGKQEDQHS